MGRRGRAALLLVYAMRDRRDACPTFRPAQGPALLNGQLFAFYRKPLSFTVVTAR